MNPYRVHLRLADGASAFAFDCDADDIVHAIEQARDAYPDDPILSAALRDGTGSGDLRRDADGEGYTLPRSAASAWIAVDSLSINVRRADDGVVVDIFALDHEDGAVLASTWAAFTEGAADPRQSDSNTRGEA